MREERMGKIVERVGLEKWKQMKCLTTMSEENVEGVVKILERVQVGLRDNRIYWMELQRAIREWEVLIQKGKVEDKVGREVKGKLEKVLKDCQKEQDERYKEKDRMDRFNRDQYRELDGIRGLMS